MPSKTTSRPLVKQALKQGYTTLQQANISSAWLDAEIIMATILKKDRAFILSHEDYPLTTSQVRKFKNFIKRRKNYEPIAYLTSHKEFYGLEFKVTKDTLVPRPESELMVEEVLKAFNSKKKTLIIDIGTGTGCLILSLLHELNKNGHETKGLALDISKKALTVAKQNAKKLNIQNITFLHSNLLSTILKKPILFKQAKHIIILANLPYLTPQEIKKEKSISREPILALDGGKNGLELYEKLAQQINLLRQDFPIPITIICEINPRQKKLFEKIWSQPADFKVDLAKKVRIGLIRFN